MKPLATISRLGAATLFLFCCLAASSDLAAEDGQEPAVTVGDFTFTPPAVLRQGGNYAYPLAKGVGKEASIQYQVVGSGRCAQVVSARSQEKNAVAALKKIMDMKVSPDMVYSLGDGLGVGIKDDTDSRGWAMLTKDGHFLFIWLYNPYPDLKGLAEGLKTDQPGAEALLTALKSPQVQSWLNFAVLAPNERMSGDRVPYTVREGWTYEEKDGEVRMVSADGRRSKIERVLKDVTSFSQCQELAEADCKTESGQKLEYDADIIRCQKDAHTRVLYTCIPRPVYVRLTLIDLDAK